MEAEFSIEYPSAQFARSIMEALGPDNKLANQEMEISASVNGRRLRVVISGCKRVETLQATVQDVFRCIRAAESSLKRTKSNP